MNGASRERAEVAHCRTMRVAARGDLPRGAAAPWWAVEANTRRGRTAGPACSRQRGPIPTDYPRRARPTHTHAHARKRKRKRKRTRTSTRTSARTCTRTRTHWRMPFRIWVRAGPSRRMRHGPHCGKQPSVLPPWTEPRRIAAYIINAFPSGCHEQRIPAQPLVHPQLPSQPVRPLAAAQLPR